MKQLILLTFIGAITIISCKTDEGPCMTDVFSPNKYKYFLPYDFNEEVIFVDESGNTDTLRITKFNITPNSYSSKDCFQPTESISAEMNLNYNSNNNCTIQYQSNLSRHPPYLVLGSTNCNLQAAIIDLGNGTINNIENYVIDEIIYDEVIEVKFEENDAGLEEIVLAKNIGFVYLKIDNSIRTAIN